MKGTDLPIPASLGFRRIGRFCARGEMGDALDGAAERDTIDWIDVLPGEDESSFACWASGHPVTYLWIPAGEHGPLYIGKADKGIASGMRAHIRSFRVMAGERAHIARAGDGGRDHAGPDHARRIRSLWAQGIMLELWARPAERCVLFGHGVSLAGAEEEALIALYDPEWNRQGQLPGAANDAYAARAHVFCER